MLSSGSWIRSYNWNSTTWLGALSTPSGYISLGASPPASGAIRIDAASYSGNSIVVNYGAITAGSIVSTADSNFRLRAASGAVLLLEANGSAKWRVLADVAGTATLQSDQVTARLVGGSSNGLAIRNSANTRDNFAIADSGVSAVLSSGTNFGGIYTSGATGEITACVYVAGGGSATDVWMLPNGSSTVGRKAAIGYYDGTQFRSALEVANVASGYSTLYLMKSGGGILVGTATGGVPGDGVINAKGFKINGVDVGTSSSSYWNATGSDIYYSAGKVLVGTSTTSAAGLVIDASAYANVGLIMKNGASSLAFALTAGGSAQLYTVSGDPFQFGANSLLKWKILAEAAGTASWQSAETTARIIGGSSNGLAIRNSGNTRDNFVVTDNGSAMTVTNGTNGGIWQATAASGERTLGWSADSSTAQDMMLGGSVTTVGAKRLMLYYNGTQFYSAAEVANVASGFGTLALMKSGGSVVIGSDPGGTTTFRVGGNMTVGLGNSYGFRSRGSFTANSDGVFVFGNEAGTDFGRLQFGGSTASFPSIKRNGAGLRLRVADDTADADLVLRALDATSNIAAASSILSSNATAGIGYTTGAGGTVTQITNRTTGVTLNKVTGAITLVSAAGSASYQTFTVTNSAVAATDVVIVNQKSGTDLYEILVTAIAAGSFNITYRTTGGTTTEQPVFNFSVIKGVAA